MEKRSCDTIPSVETAAVVAPSGAILEPSLEPQRDSAPPDGGARAWLVTLGGFSVIFCSSGFLNTFGVFQNFYAFTFLSHESTSTISWIGSLQVFLLFLGGLFSGPLTDRYGARAVLLPSSGALVLSTMLTSLCTKQYQFLLCQGVLQGFAFGMLYTPAYSIAGQYFDRSRALAMGLVASGAAAGGIVWPILVDQLLNSTKLGFGWTMRLAGFIMLGLLSFACAIMVERVPRRTSKLILPEAFLNKSFVLLNCAFFLTVIGLYAPIFFVVDYATSLGIDVSLASYELAILNGSSFFGRYLGGVVADRLGRFNMYIVACLASCVLLLCWTAARSFAGLTVFTVVYGITSGSVISLYPACMAQVCPKARDLGTYMGMGVGFFSISGLGSGPASGALISAYGYLACSIFCGVLVFLAALCAVFARLHMERRVLVAF